MFLSKRSNGIYYIFYKSHSGKISCKSTGCKTKSEANKYLSEFGRNIDKISFQKTIPISLKEFFFQFLRFSESVHSVNHTNSLKITFKTLLNFTDAIQLSELTFKKLQEFIDYRNKNLSAYTVKRDIANLSSAFSWGISHNYLTDNYCKSIKKPKIVEKIPAFFSEEELNKLLAVIDNQDLKDLIRFAVNTGLRQSELILLRWNQINFRDNYMILDNNYSVTKSKKVRTIPLNITALQILTERQLKVNSNFIFTYLDQPIKQQFISHKFKKIIRKANLNPRRVCKIICVNGF